MEKQIAHLMKTLDLTEDEAREMLADDEAIEKGADLFPLTVEQEKASKQARSTGTRIYTFTQREHKADNDKRELINLLLYALEFCEIPHEISDIIKTNAERQIDFIYNGRAFRIVLSAPRTNPSK